METKEIDGSTETVRPSVIEAKESVCGRYCIFTKQKFSIEIPKDWEIVATNIMSDFGIQFITAKVYGGYSPSLNLNITPIERSMDFCQLITEAKNGLVTMGITDITTGNIEISGRRWEVLSGNDSRTTVSDLKYRSYVTQMTDAHFCFTFSYQQSTLSEYEDVVDRMMRTFRPIE